MLATLFKDERCQYLPSYGILEKMYLDRIIRGNQLQEFAALLQPHQKATTADGQSQAALLTVVYVQGSYLSFSFRIRQPIVMNSERVCPTQLS